MNMGFTETRKLGTKNFFVILEDMDGIFGWTSPESMTLAGLPLKCNARTCKPRTGVLLGLSLAPVRVAKE